MVVFKAGTEFKYPLNSSPMLRFFLLGRMIKHLRICNQMCTCCSSWLVLLSQVGSSIPESTNCITTLASDVDKLRDRQTRSLHYANYDLYFSTAHTFFTREFVWPSVVRDAAVSHHLSSFHLTLSHHDQHQIPQSMLDILSSRYNVHSRAEQLLYNKVRALITVYTLK